MVQVQRAKYTDEWLSWWAGMNPGWRERDEDGWPIIGGTGDWSELIRSGPNGFLSVLMSLIGLQDVAEKPFWLKAVGDVTWVLEQLKTAAAQGYIFYYLSCYLTKLITCWASRHETHCACWWRKVCE